MDQTAHTNMDGNPSPPADAMADLNINYADETAIAHDARLPQWKNITTFLDEATEDFEVGQLVHLESLTLFDAMSAIEVMDPKMDTGMVVPGQQNIFDVEKRLEAEELLWVMDRLLTCEMGWIAGNSLSQTIYTCIYFHHVPTLAEPSTNTSLDLPEVLYIVLKAYILGVVKCRQYIFQEMTRLNVYEEEDFTSNLFGLPLYEEYIDADILNALNSAFNALKELLAGIQSHDPKRVVLEAIQDRISARMSYMLALMSLSRLQSASVEKTLTELTKAMEMVKKNIAKTIDLVTNRIINTIGSGVEVEGAFDPNINRKLTSQTPPRPIVMKSDSESYNDFLLLLQRLYSICGVTEYPSIGSLINYFLSFASTRPYPDAFSRSVLNSFFYRNNRVFGIIPVEEFLKSAILGATNPPKGGLKPKLPKKTQRDQLNIRQDAFMKEASLLFIDFFKIQCHNRARQRRILCKELAKWEDAEQKALLLDDIAFNDDEEEDPPYYHTSWVYMMRLRIMGIIQEIGAELELYSNQELPMTYWFLEHIIEEQQALYHRIAIFTEHMMLAMDQGYIPSTPRPPHPDDGHIWMNQCQRQGMHEMATGTFKLLALTRDDKTPRFDDPATRFNHRFKYFTAFIKTNDYDLFRVERERFPTFKEYRKALSKYITDDRAKYHSILKNIKNHFETAFGLLGIPLEGIKRVPLKVTQTEMCQEAFFAEQKALHLVCKMNRMAIMKLERILSTKSTKSATEALSKESTAITISFKDHSRWPTIIVSTRSK